MDIEKIKKIFKPSIKIQEPIILSGRQEEEIKNNENLKKLLSEFDLILESSSEQDIHSFLENNSWLLGFNSWNSFVVSKFRLADKYIPDFVDIGMKPYSNVGYHLTTFIEIERANEKLFTKSGDPTSFLTHAIRQVQDWKRWVSENKEYLKKEIYKLSFEKKSSSIANEEIDEWKIRAKDLESTYFPWIDEYMVIAGRRSQMTIDDRLRLYQMNRDLHGIRIITYDVLIDIIFRQLSGYGRYDRPYYIN